MGTPDGDRLAEIEGGIVALDDPAALIADLDAMADLATRRDGTAVRYGIARGIVLNRLGLPGSALTELHKARRLAREIEEPALLSKISREIGRVHGWRGETASAALELLRSMVEADADANAADRAATVAEFGRLNLETGRYQAALAAFEAAADQTDLLTTRERSRLPVNRCEALAALGRYQDCLAALEASIAGTPDGFRRDHFVMRLLKARCLAATGHQEAATSAAAEADAWLTDDPQSYERAERALLAGALESETNPEHAAAMLDNALDRFVEDDLPRHEFDARILLAEVLSRLDRQPQAEACIVEALRRAEARQLPAMADRVRAAAVKLWRPERITDLSVDDRVGPDTGSGRFLVLETLGSGGFGEVERAIDLDTGGEVAIKHLRFNLQDAPERARLAVATVRNEVTAAARLPSRHIAGTRYLHLGSDGGVTLVQDYVAGSTLRRALADDAIDFGRRMAIAAAIARTLATLHRVGLAHRDLKPDNVILRGGTQPVLIDLGLARLKGVADTVAGLGTEGYAPPEQMKGAAVDPGWFGREDVFALGRMIEEMAAIDDTDDARSGWFGRLGRRRSGRLDGELAAMVDTMTHRDVARRAVDLNRLADALDAAAIA